jgi:phage terminase small subunit
MARKSATKQAAESNIHKDRIAPPSMMSPKARKIYTEIVNSFPAERFIESDGMFLAEYCEALADMREIRRQWNKLKSPMLNAEGDGPHPLRRMISDAQGRLAVMATKLRLVPVGRIRNDAPRKSFATPPKSKRRMSFDQ